MDCTRIGLGGESGDREGDERAGEVESSVRAASPCRAASVDMGPSSFVHEQSDHLRARSAPKPVHSPGKSSQDETSVLWMLAGVVDRSCRGWDLAGLEVAITSRVARTMRTRITGNHSCSQICAATFARRRDSACAAPGQDGAGNGRSGRETTGPAGRKDDISAYEKDRGVGNEEESKGRKEGNVGIYVCMGIGAVASGIWHLASAERAREE